ncbi:phage tail protein [Schleiferilactobacillus harbinensis]|uniref:phage tail assembly chaperone n=1 Tax=Schleiferilactobacillus harbinensis TaxID=304207 RepID=UPI0021A350DC|nr:phage tail assembly chaperone [Schleiferilactobacillus harbinensis]MCT2909765.1 phage tail protein [Schleiferilactobacillus harbinensis]
MKIKEQLLSNREHNVKVSNRVLRNTLKYQLSMAEADDGDDKTVPEKLHMSLDTINNTEQYIIDTLKLNKDEQEKLDNLAFDDTLRIANHVVLRVQGLSEENIQLATKQSQSADKSEKD